MIDGFRCWLENNGCIPIVFREQRKELMVLGEESLAVAAGLSFFFLEPGIGNLGIQYDSIQAPRICNPGHPRASPCPNLYTRAYTKAWKKRLWFLISAWFRWSQESELNRRPTDYELVWRTSEWSLYCFKKIDIVWNAKRGVYSGNCRKLPKITEKCPHVAYSLRTVFEGHD
jgi:hypothetical protein